MFKEFLFKKKQDSIENLESVNPVSCKYEKIQEPSVEQIETGKNKVKIYYTGRQRLIKSLDESSDAKAIEVDKIEIINEQNKKFDFSSLLPKNWRFCKLANINKDENLASKINLFTLPTFKEIWFPDSYFDISSLETKKIFSQPSDLLSLLHEIGHVSKGEKVIMKQAKEEDKIKNYFFINKKRKQDYYQYVIIPERDAWAFALRQYRKLKEQGIDIFPPKTSNKQIIEEIHYCLSSYLNEIVAKSFKDPEIIKIKKIVAEKIKKPQSRWEKFKDKIITEIISNL